MWCRSPSVRTNWITLQIWRDFAHVIKASILHSPDQVWLGKVGCGRKLQTEPSSGDWWNSAHKVGFHLASHWNLFFLSVRISCPMLHQSCLAIVCSHETRMRGSGYHTHSILYLRFHQVTEDDVHFRIYKLGSLEVRRCKSMSFDACQILLQRDSSLFSADVFVCFREVLFYHKFWF